MALRPFGPVLVVNEHLRPVAATRAVVMDPSHTVISTFGPDGVTPIDVTTNSFGVTNAWLCDVGPEGFVWVRFGSLELPLDPKGSDTSGGGGGGAVASVNGQTGVVVLSAASVGALPDSYTPTWASVTGKPANFPPSAHTHAAADVTSGVLAPARLGTGTADATTVLYGDGSWKAAPSGGGGVSVVDNGDGSVTVTGSAVIDNGDGSVTI